MNACGYIRISTKDQSVYSLEYQERAIRQYCTTNNLNLLAVFKDDGESSYTFDRPDWLALESFIKSNKSVEYLVVLDHDRFSRNLAEALMKIKELHDKFSIKVLATTDSFETDFSDPSTFLMRAFKLMMAEGELWRIRQRTKAGMLQAALNGRHANVAPFGYKNARDESGKPILIMDDEKAYIVRMIFKEYLHGTGIEEIRRMVTPLGFTRRGSSAIQEILSNPVYAGMVKIPPHKGNLATIGKGIHRAIISEGEYWQAQPRLQGKRINTQIKDEVPLRGVLRCPECGQLMTAGNSKGRKKYYWYYLCNTHKKNFPASLLHGQLNEILDLFSYSAPVLEWFKEKLSEEISNHLGSRGELLASTTKAIRNNRDKVEAAEEKYLTGEVSKTVYNKVISRLRSEGVELERRLSDLQGDQQGYWDRLTRLLPKLHDIRGTYDELPLVQKQQFLSLVFDNSVSHDGKSYRTAYLDPTFSHNELILKEKGLLIIDPKLWNLIETPNRAPDRNPIESLIRLSDLLAA